VEWISIFAVVGAVNVHPAKLIKKAIGENLSFAVAPVFAARKNLVRRYCEQTPHQRALTV
jgi:hypothetical protein